MHAQGFSWASARSLVSVALVGACVTWASCAVAQGELPSTNPGARQDRAQGAPELQTDRPQAPATVAGDEAVPGGDEPVDDTVEEARRRFDRGVRLYAEGDYPLALIEFERAYELVSNYR